MHVSDASVLYVFLFHIPLCVCLMCVLPYMYVLHACGMHVSDACVFGRICIPVSYAFMCMLYVCVASYVCLICGMPYMLVCLL